MLSLILPEICFASGFNLYITPSVLFYLTLLTLFSKLQSFILLKKSLLFIIYFVVNCFIIKDSLSINYIFLHLHKVFE